MFAPDTPVPGAQVPRLIVTRPEPEASRWVQALNAQGQPAWALPLIVIAPEPVSGLAQPQPGSEPGASASMGIASPVALMFVSGAAVRAYFSGQPLASRWSAPMRCWCTGPGTAAALRDAGVPEQAIDTPALDGGQFDSEALWALLQAQQPHQVQPGVRVCIVRGGDAQGRPAGRDWLANTLRQAGAQVHTVVAYRRLPPPVDADWRARVQAAVAAGDVWLFSSSESVVNLQMAMAQAPALNWAACRALATHPRIADAALRLGFGQVKTVSPLWPEVLKALRVD